MNICSIIALFLMIFGCACSSKEYLMPYDKYYTFEGAIFFDNDTIHEKIIPNFRYYLPFKMVRKEVSFLEGVISVQFLKDNQMIMIEYNPTDTLSVKDMIESVEKHMTYYDGIVWKKEFNKYMDKMDPKRKNEVIRIEGFNIGLINIIPHNFHFIKRIISETFEFNT